MPFVLNVNVVHNLVDMSKKWIELSQEAYTMGETLPSMRIFQGIILVREKDWMVVTKELNTKNKIKVSNAICNWRIQRVRLKFSW